MRQNSDLSAIVGPVAADEYERAPESVKPRLMRFAQRLQSTPDADLTDELSSEIYGAAVLNSRGTSSVAVDFVISACYHESERRKIRDGHDPSCRPETLYTRAYGRATREALGRSLQQPCECTCGVEHPTRRNGK